MEPILYKCVRPLIKGFVNIVYRPKIIGKDNIPKTGRVVLAGTHTNFFDCILLISCTKRCVHFLAKDSLIKGYKKIIFKNMGIIPVNRKIKDKEALTCAINYLNDDKLIGIFPEGTINRTDDIIMPFKIGAVKMAYETNSPIIPFAIVGEYKPFKKGLKIIFGKAITVNNEDLSIENDILRNKVIDLIMEGRNYGKDK